MEFNIRNVTSGINPVQDVLAILIENALQLITRHYPERTGTIGE
jgi:hypothetical protein